MGEYAKKSDNQYRALHGNPKASKQASADVILQQYRERSIQRYATKEDEELLQSKSESAFPKEQKPVQREEKPNNTGLPDNLKTRIENLSGYSMDDVNVHYNSPNPAQLQALAYTQGTDIHVAPGQEKHLPHEAWHVVQQKQGRVQPTMQMKGINVNDDAGLEREADEIAAIESAFVISSVDGLKNDYNLSAIQCKWKKHSENNEMLIWDKPRSGLCWYYDQNTDKMYFTIKEEKKVPPDLLDSYKTQANKPKSYDEWQSDFVTYLDMAESNTKPGRARFGMELELLTKKSYYSTNASAGNVPEEKVKAKKIFSIGYGTVDVTFDTRTGYRENSDQNLTVELIFNAKRIPLISDLEALGDTLVHEISEITFESFDKELESTDFIDSVKKTEIDDQQKLIFPSQKNIGLNIHITMAMSLNDIGYIMKYDQSSNLNSNTTKLKQKLRIGTYPRIFTKEVKNDALAFIRIIDRMFDYNNKECDDPKQNMNIMNRTSFGKMFLMMDTTSQSQILNWLQVQIDNKEKENWRLTKKSPQTISQFKDYFTELNKNETTSDKDLTYLANINEKLGISHLGDKTELDILGVESPIFEFRVGSDNLKLDKIPNYLGELRTLLMDYYLAKAKQGT